MRTIQSIARSVMDAQQASVLQLQLRHNTEELQDYLKGLESWEEEMKAKDRGLSKNKPILKETLPPVRSHASGSTEMHKTDEQKKKRRAKPKPAAPSDRSAKATRIRSFDYRSWDKFDVDRACEEVEYEARESSGSEGEEEEEEKEEEQEKEEEEEEEEEEKKQRHQAVMEKEKGNALYKEGQYELAVECYSRGMILDPLSAALPANRAMALLKLERYAAVEEDCNTVLALDDGYMKAYLRRGVARRHLGKLQEAIQDFEAAVRLEPGSKQASSELKKTQQEQEERERARLVSLGHVFPIKRPPHVRSKKPLRRIVIEDIDGQIERGGEDSSTMVSSSSSSALPVGHNGRAAVGSSRETQTPVATNTTESVTPAQHSSTNSNVDTVSRDSDVECRSTLDGSTAENGRGLTSDSPVSFEGKENEVPEEVPEADLLPVPQTSLQFQSHWKQLRKERSQLVAYFKRLPPSSFPVLLQQSLETDIFSDIISILQEEYTQYKVSCVDELRWLTRVKRFTVAVMFLSKKDKERLKTMFESLMELCDGEDDVSNVKQLANDFAVKL